MEGFRIGDRIKVIGWHRMKREPSGVVVGFCPLLCIQDGEDVRAWAFVQMDESGSVDRIRLDRLERNET